TTVLAARSAKARKGPRRLMAAGGNTSSGPAWTQKEGGLEKDPVCGMDVDPARPPHRHEHEGRQYCFCAAACRDRFAADPARYVPANVPVPVPVRPPVNVNVNVNVNVPVPVRSAASPWTCPMHAEVVRDRPGSCPICGMALEPRVASMEPAEDPELRSMSRRLWISAP